MALGPTWNPACIGVGSNLDDPVAQVRQALASLESLDDTRLLVASSLYRNPPMGPIDQPDYINAVAIVLTQLGPRALLDSLQAIERAQGRAPERGTRWGPRCVDLDILTYGYREIDEPGLRIPHSGISERNFVLFPMLEIAPQLHVPGLGAVRRLVAESDESTLEKIP
jgi:2-amino-4-hydroxy-6-hydroxymethyldihydropteridine diphosphokinase